MRDDGTMPDGSLDTDSRGSNRRPKSLILDIYGRYAPQFHGWIAVGNLIELMGLLDVDEQAVRSAVSRMTRRSLLTPEVRGTVRGYRTTPEAEEVFADADRRIYTSMEPAQASDGWVLVSFSMPESERDKRHVLRSKLMWHGMGNLTSGLWIAPARILADIVDTVKALGFGEYTDVFHASYEGMGEVDELVRRSWDLPALAVSYEHFLHAHAPVRDRLKRRGTPVSGEEAFTSYTRALHEWRKFPYLDPGLPTDLLPSPWPGRRAAELFGDLRARLEPLAFDFAARIAHR